MSGWGWGYDRSYGTFDGYGSLNLSVTSPLQNWQEPFTVEEACTFLNIDPPDDDEVDRYNEIQGFISAAREQAEILQGRDLVRKQWDLSLDYWTTYRIPLRAPLVSVDLIQYTDSNGNVTTLTAGTNYLVDTRKQVGALYPPYNGSWPSFTAAPSSGILIRFTSGYTNADPFWKDSGARIKVGMKRLISEWHNKRMAFEVGYGAVESNWSVMSCLSYGAIVRVR